MCPYSEHTKKSLHNTECYVTLKPKSLVYFTSFLPPFTLTTILHHSPFLLFPISFTFICTRRLLTPDNLKAQHDSNTFYVESPIIFEWTNWALTRWLALINMIPLPLMAAVPAYDFIQVVSSQGTSDPPQSRRCRCWLWSGWWRD